MKTMSLEPWSVHLAQRERKLVADRLAELRRRKKTSWDDREISGLQRDLVEIDDVIVRHRAMARYGVH